MEERIEDRDWEAAGHTEPIDKSKAAGETVRVDEFDDVFL